MARTKLINGVRLPFTAEQETAWDAKEAAWAAGAFDRSMIILRDKRNNLLARTDFYALHDVTMTQDMTNYRKVLRDITKDLTTVEEVNAVTWPIKPGA